MRRCHCIQAKKRSTSHHRMQQLIPNPRNYDSWRIERSRYRGVTASRTKSLLPEMMWVLQPTTQPGGYQMTQKMSPLRRRMIEDMTVRNLSPATQRSYISAVLKFSRYFGRSPDQLELEDVRAFQVHLVSTGISWPGLNQIVCALRFFYGVTLGEPLIPDRIPYAREPHKLPVVLSADEVVQFLEAVSSLKSRAALTTAYAAGLRASVQLVRRSAKIPAGKSSASRSSSPAIPTRVNSA